MRAIIFSVGDYRFPQRRVLGKMWMLHLHFHGHVKWRFVEVWADFTAKRGVRMADPTSVSTYRSWWDYCDRRDNLSWQRT
jgi:hypothetical protein